MAILKGLFTYILRSPIIGKISREKLIDLPKIINNNELQQAKLSLDDAENILNSISTDRRIRT